MNVCIALPVTVSSPNGDIQLNIFTAQQYVKYSVEYDNKNIISPSACPASTIISLSGVAGLRYTMVYGKSQIRN